MPILHMKDIFIDILSIIFFFYLVVEKIMTPNSDHVYFFQGIPLIFSSLFGVLSFFFMFGNIEN